MGTVKIHQRHFDIDGIIFDKDDTLVEFSVLWGPRIQRWVETITGLAGLPNSTRSNLYTMLGYSPEQSSVRAESPLAIASIETLVILVAGVLCQQGIPWHQAYHYAISTAQDTTLADIEPREIQPKGNVKKVLYQLAQANIRIAVVTNDDRSMTEATLSHLGVRDIVSVIVSGDDPVPNKPAPDAFHMVVAEWGITPKRIMMVGDTLSDMKFAVNAGAAYRIGVLSKSGNSSLLASHCDVVVNSIDEIQVTK